MRRWMRFAARAIVLLGVVLTATFQARPQDLSASSVPSTIPFELVSDFVVVVNGQVGQLGGLRFIVDTGATHTYIDRKVADKLQLRQRPGKVINFDREMPVGWAEIPELRVGPIRAAALQVVVVDLAEYSGFAKNADGIIGLDLLGKTKKFSIDYQSRTVSLQLADGESRDASVPQCYVIRLTVQGLPMRLVIDTGFQGILLYKDRLRKGLPNMRTEGESTEVSLGRQQATAVKLPGVRILGPEKVATVFLIDGPKSGELPGVDGYLGTASLHAKRIEFDFASRQLHWQ